jgi:trans-aconitate methyltransferase
MTEAGQHWDTSLYDTTHSYVWRYGEGVLGILEAQPGERILDLGAGTGHLTARIAEAGATVIGLDASSEMVAQAKQLYPNIDFIHADASDFRFNEPFDAVFSNATLHWVKKADEAVQSIAAALKRGGRFVAEFGGRGNGRAVIGALQAARDALGFELIIGDRYPWFFPGIAQYSAMLERHGLEVTMMQLFDRPTPQDEGENGLRLWYQMFASNFLSDLPEDRREAVLVEAENRIREKQFIDGTWYVDYRRLRVVAKKVVTNLPG